MNEMFEHKGKMSNFAGIARGKERPKVLTLYIKKRNEQKSSADVILSYLHSRRVCFVKSWTTSFCAIKI